MVPFLLVVYYFMDVYYVRRSRPFRKEVLIVTRAHFMGIVLIDTFLYLNKQLEYSREVSLRFALSGFLLLLLERFVVRKILHYLRKIGYNQKHMLIIGAGPVGMEFASKVLTLRYFGYNVVGFLDDDEKKQGCMVLNKPVLGSSAKLTELLDNQLLDEVVVALPLHDYEKYGSIVAICEKAGVRLRIIPPYYEFFSGSFTIEAFDGIPLLNICKIPLDGPIYKFIKRFFDLAAAAIAIILTGPLMICIALHHQARCSSTRKELA